MARKIIYRENGLTGSNNVPDGYKYVGYDGSVLSEKAGATISVVVPFIDTFDHINFTDQLAVNVPHSPGRIYYANGSWNLYVDEPDITLQVGEENWVRVKNISGSTITDGQVVYIDGAQGQSPTIELATNTTHLTSHTNGLATHAIEHNSTGYITTTGIVNGVDTSDFNDGDEIFLGIDPGSITNVKPIAPIHVVKLGNVIRANNNGSILVSLSQSIDLNDLTEVLITAPANHDELRYDSASESWKNGPPQDLSYETITTSSSLTQSRRVFCNNTAPITVTAPASPVINLVFEIVDSNGNAGTQSITFDGNGKTINGLATQVLSTNYDKLHVVYNGVEWNII